MEIRGKIWGSTSKIFDKNNVQVERMILNSNSFCSKHKHNHKFNMFFVEKGKIKVSVWKKSYNLVDVTVLESNQCTIVPPGEFHQFEVLEENSIVFEFYWTETNDNDIERETVGGINNHGEEKDT